MALFERFYLDRRPDAQLRSIVRHLNDLLNSRKGFSTFLPDYGLGDFNEYKAREAIIATVIDEIRHSIERYEPRVQLERIREVDSPSLSKIRLELRCRLETGQVAGGGPAPAAGEGARSGQAAAERPIYILIDTARQQLAVEPG